MTAVTVTSLVMSVPELVMNCLLPLMTQWPSSSFAVVLVAPASVPPPASVSPNAPSALPLAKQRQPLLLLLLVAEAVHRHRAERHAGLQRDGDALVDLAELLEREAQREVVAAHAAVLLGERQAEQPHVGHARHDLVWERVLFVVLGGDGRHDALREVAHRLGELLVVVGQRAGGQKFAHDCFCFLIRW